MNKVERTSATTCVDGQSTTACNGDPINCAMLQKLTIISCVPTEKNTIVGGLTTPDGLADLINGFDSPVETPDEYDVSQYLDYAGLGWGGSCPAPKTYNLGSVGSMDIDLSPFCSLAEIIAFMVMFTATAISLRILFTD